MKLSLRDPYAISADGFWSELFFDPTYNRALYTEGLGFEGVEVLEERVEAGRRVRRMRVRPRLVLPAALKSLIGDAVTYVEEGTFDAAKGTFTTRIVPSVLADRLRIETVMRCEPRGADRCERVADVDIGVRVLGLGGLLEKFLERTMRDSYAKAAAFSARWLSARPSATGSAG